MSNNLNNINKRKGNTNIITLGSSYWERVFFENLYCFFCLLWENHLICYHIGDRNLCCQTNCIPCYTICIPETDPLCPIFQLGKIVELADVNFDEIAYKVSSGSN